MTLSSPDVERSAAFYGSVLDWEFSPPNPNGGRHVVNTTMPIGLRPTQDEYATTAPGEIVMWFIARGALSDIDGSGEVEVKHRFYHVPASNTAVGHLILENQPNASAAGKE